jgi:hypothetical protein
MKVIRLGSREQPNMHAILVRHRHVGVDKWITNPWVRVFDVLECLEKLYGHETGFRKGVLFCVKVSFLFSNMTEVDGLRPRQILGPPLKGTYCQPLILLPSHLSGTNFAASGPQRSVRRCIAQTE